MSLSILGEPESTRRAATASADRAVGEAGRRLPSFAGVLDAHAPDGLRRSRVATLQVNVGKRCNQACHHCHVGAGPTRAEMMTRPTAARVLELLESSAGTTTLDITGGAPELNESFRFLVSGARRLGREVIDRCNLTVLLQPGQEETPAFLAGQGVHVIASLPCYSAGNVDAQRGRHVYERSIEALRLLNGLGYGRPDGGLRLDLVYNPGGAFLPPAQAELEETYRRELGRRHGIEFNRLLTLTNMPIQRFAEDLIRRGSLSEYLSLLVNHFNPETVQGLMCRTTLSVGYDGTLYDCDFNQMLEMPLARWPTLDGLRSLDQLDGAPVSTAVHCFGCTAGAGSGCGGALTVD